MSAAALDRDVDDPRAGLFGPDSVVWRVDREAALFLGAGRALLMQLAHPAVAQAIVDHSPVRHSPVARYYRTFRPVFAMVFGGRDQALACARRVQRVHAAISGTMPEALGRFAAGERYRADDPAALRWVYATLCHTSLLVHDAVLPPLDEAARDAYCRQSRRFGMLFGLEADALPADWRALDALVATTLADGSLAVGTAGAELARFFFGREGGLAARLMPRWYVALTASLLPQALRDAFGLPWGVAEERRARRALAVARRVCPRLPRRLRFVGPWHEARERLAGRAEPALPTRLSNRIWLGCPRLPEASPVDVATAPGVSSSAP